MFLFLNPVCTAVGVNQATTNPPVGLVSMATLLRQQGFEAEVLDANLEGGSPEAVGRRVVARRPRVLGLKLGYHDLRWSSELIAFVRARARGTLIGVGGPLPSYSPENALRRSGADFAVQGEGEGAVLAIARNLEAGEPYHQGVPGLHRIVADGLVQAAPAERIADLDALPFPDYDLVGGLARYSRRSRCSPAAPIFVTRGCPFHCSFCAKHVFGDRVTSRSPESVLAEVEALQRRYGIRQLDMLDDNFAVHGPTMERILDLFIERRTGVAINLLCGLRVENLEPATLHKMQRAGVSRIALGIESADPAVLQGCDKRLDLERVRSVARIALGLGIDVVGFIVIGLPGETREGVEATVRFARELGLDTVNITMASPFPGTALFDLVERRGRFLCDPHGNQEFGFFSSTPRFVLPGLPEVEVRRRFEYAYRSFYTPSVLLRRISRVRSLGEARWFFHAGRSVLRGMAHGRTRARGPTA